MSSKRKKAAPTINPKTTPTPNGTISPSPSKFSPSSSLSPMSPDSASLTSAFPPLSRPPSKPHPITRASTTPSSFMSPSLSLAERCEDAEMGPLEDDTNGNGNGNGHQRNQSSEIVKSDKNQQPLLGWYGVAMVALTLALFSLGLNLYVELSAHSTGSALVHTATSVPMVLTVSMAALFVAVPLTHGVAGSRRYGSRVWTFWQPFVGGFRFVFLQFIGWAAWSLSMLAGIYVAWVGTKQVASGLLASMGVGGLIGQIAVLASLQFFTSSTSTTPTTDDTVEPEDISPSSAVLPRMDIKTPAQQAEARRQKKEQPLLGWEGVGNVGVSLTLLSFALAIILESMKLSVVSHLSITTLATSAILIAVPLTHVLAGRRRDKHYQLFQPFRGGTKFVTLQALGWALWTIAILSAFLAIYLGSQDIRISGIITSAGVGGVLSQALVFLSLRYFDSRISASVCVASAQRRRQKQMTEKEIKQICTLIDESSPRDTTSPPISLARSQTVPLRKLYSSADIILTDENNTAHPFNLHDIADVASSLDYDLIERILEHTRLQCISRSHHQAWSRLSTAMGIHTTKTTTIHVRTPASVSHISWHQWKTGVAEYVSRLRSMNWYETYLDARALCIIIIIYSLPFLGTLIFFSPFFILYATRGAWYGWCIAALELICYFWDYKKRDYITGARSWNWLRYNTVLWGSFERYFDGTIIPVGKLDPNKKYMYGFHPHGIYPMTVFWATRGPSWKKFYPGCELDVLGATIMYFAPLMREMLLWAGGRDVSRASIRHALESNRSVLLIPGGQREMRMSTFGRDELHLVTAHQGFVKQALQYGADLVPILSLGETQVLSNIHAPHMQSLTTKYIGFGLPMLPHGRWYSPLPNPTKVTVIVGSPIPVPKTSDPSPELVHSIHQMYYDQIKELFHTYKEQAGYPNCQLIFSKGI